MEFNRKKTKLKPKTGADPGFFLGGCALVSSNKPHSFFVAFEQAFGRAGNYAIFFPRQRACSQASFFAEYQLY